MSKKILLSLGTDTLLFQEGSAVRERIRGYAKDWDEMHIVVAADKSYRETALAPNIWIYPTRSRFRALYPLDMIRLGKFIIAGRGVTHITCQDPFLTGMAGISLKRQSSLPLEIQVHTDIGSPNFTYTIGNKVRKALALSYLPKADTIRVVSNKIKDYIVNTLGISAVNVTVRPIAVDVEKFKWAPITVDLHDKYPQFKKIALMASRLTREKDIARALSAWSFVKIQSPGAGMVIVGTGPEEARLKHVAHKLGISDVVVFETWLDQPTLASYYKTADLFMSTSLFEGYGMTLVEAHAAGCRIVSTDVGVAREIGATIVDWDDENVARGVIQALGV